MWSVDLPESKGVQSNATTIRKSAEEVKLEKGFFQARKNFLAKAKIANPYTPGILGQYGIELLFMAVPSATKMWWCGAVKKVFHSTSLRVIEGTQRRKAWSYMAFKSPSSSCLLSSLGQRILVSHYNYRL